jgi:hypothetical protein
MSNGKLVNMGHPYELLSDKTTLFFDLVQNLDKKEQDLNFSISKDNYLKKYNSGISEKLPLYSNKLVSSSDQPSNQQTETDFKESSPLLSNNL